MYCMNINISYAFSYHLTNLDVGNLVLWTHDDCSSVSSSFSARCICGEVLRSMADSRCADRSKGPYKAWTLSSSGIPAQLTKWRNSRCSWARVSACPQKQLHCCPLVQVNTRCFLNVFEYPWTLRTTYMYLILNLRETFIHLLPKNCLPTSKQLPELL